jgi:O-antigen ligase
MPLSDRMKGFAATWSGKPQGTTDDIRSSRSLSSTAGPVTIYSATFFCALAYLFVDYGRPQSWIPAIGLLRPGLLALGSGLVAVIFYGSLPKDRLTKYILWFLALMVVLVPFATNRNRAFYTTWSFALLLFGGLMPIALFVDSFPRLQRLIRFWVAIHVSLALYVIKNGGAGVGSFLIDENDVALAMNVALPYGIALVIAERGLALRIFAVASTLLIAFASAATLSRGGFIGLACVGVIVWFQSKRKVLSLLGLAVLAGMLFLAAPAKYWSDIGTITTANQKGDTGYQRIYSWQVAWRIFLDHPIFGVGPNNYPYTAWRYETEVSNQIGYHLYGRAAHSLYFTLLPEFGIAGTGLFAGMVITGVQWRRRLRRQARAAQARPGLTLEQQEQARWLHQLSVGIDAALVGFLASGTFLSVLFYPHIWVLTAFTTAVSRVGMPLLDNHEAAPSAGETSTPDSILPDTSRVASAHERPSAWPSIARASP